MLSVNLVKNTAGYGRTSIWMDTTFAKGHIMNRINLINDDTEIDIKNSILKGPVCPYRKFLHDIFGWRHLKTTCKYRKILRLEQEHKEAIDAQIKYEKEFPNG